MQVFLKANLAFISVPKTGSTAYEIAMRPHADIVFTKRLKHMTAGKFHNKFRPFLQETYGRTPELMAVMRDPIDQIRSWYKYRSPERLGMEDRHSTGGMSFDEYVLEVISDDPAPCAGIGQQFGFLTVKGKTPVDHLFAYEHQLQIRAFIEDRLDTTLSLKDKNVSPDIPAPISPEVETRLRKARAKEFSLYEKVLDAGGVLRKKS